MAQKMKDIIKKLPFANSINTIRHAIDFDKDKKFFAKNYMYSKSVTKEKLEYDMLFQIHKLEKGFSVINGLRPFGIKEIEKIIDDLKKYEEKEFEKSFAYNLAYSSLKAYLKFYEKNNWIDKPQYVLVNDFMKDKNRKYTYIPVGSFDYSKKVFIKEATLVDYDKFISTRKSIRNFSPKSISSVDIKKVVTIATKTPTACNRQMCKVYYIKSKKGKDTIEKYAQGLGLFDLSNASYFVVTFDISANYFFGERNQGWFNAGLLTTNFINGLHSLGIGSCCIQFGNSFKEEKLFKKSLDIPDSERIAVIIVAGYYDDVSRVPYSARRPIEEIYRER